MGGYETPDQDRSDDADGQIDEENPMPGKKAQDEPAEGRAGNEADRNHGTADAESLAAFGGWKGLGDDSGAQGGHHHRANGLEDARENKHRDIGGQSAKCRPDGEDNKTAQVERLFTDHVRQPPDAEHESGDGEHISKHDPLDDGEIGVQIPLQDGEGNINDTAIDRGEEHSRGHGGHDEPLPAAFRMDGVVDWVKRIAHGGFHPIKRPIKTQ